MNKFNPTRLSLARKRRLLNKKQLSKLVGVHPQTISLWEAAQTEEPSEENVKSLAYHLKFPVQFFYCQDIDEPSADSTSFRSQTAMTAAIRDAALAAGAMGNLISDWIEDRFELPVAQIPDLQQYSDPENAARILREVWGLGEKPISNMIHLLESKGVRVFSLAENTITVNAYSLWRNEKPYVFLNTFKSAECSRFDAAHELAHLALHQDGSTSGRQAEDQANAFASSFLMPRSDVIAKLPSVSHLGQLIYAKERWKVSLAALNYRVHKLGIISDWKYRDFCIQISSNGYHKREPNEMPREQSSVWNKVLKALWAEGTTHLDIASQLSLPESEVSDLICGVLSSASPERPSLQPNISLVG